MPRMGSRSAKPGKSRLTERYDLRAERVDREAKVLRGVKVIGLESRNGRLYRPEALAAAVPLYEGKAVRVNHPRKPGDSRDSYDVMGWLTGMHARDDGLYGDLHYLESHPISARVVEAAERNQSLFGLSHDADGDKRREGQVEVVYEITEVYSVDLVADPATTGGLFEEQRVRIKLKAFTESFKLSPARRRLLDSLFESGAMCADTEMPEGADAGHEEALGAAFEAAGLAVMQAAMSGSLDHKDALKRLKKLLGAHTDVTGKEEPAEPTPESEDEPDEGGDDVPAKKDDEKDKKTEESLKRDRRIRDLEAKDEARTLCEEASLAPGKAFLEALVALPDAAARKRLIEERKAEIAAGGRERPRTGPANGGGRPTPGAAQITDGASLAKALLG